MHFRYPMTGKCHLFVHIINIAHWSLSINNSIWCILLPSLSTQAGCETRLISKRSLTSLNSEFFFSYTSCHTKVKEPSLPYYFTDSWKKKNWIHTFPKDTSAIWNANSLMQDLNLGHCIYFLRRYTTSISTTNLIWCRPFWCVQKYTEIYI